MEIQAVAHIRNGFLEKFGVPRQSGLAEGVVSRVVFEPEYRNRDAVRGLDGFGYIWLIWGFSLCCGEDDGGRGCCGDEAGDSCLGDGRYVAGAELKQNVDGTVPKRRWTAMVRPPRLGGNRKMGVFATRSPFRPNPVGLSSVRVIKIEYDCPEGPVIYVSGADLVDGTPIFDIKPYLPYADSHPGAAAGWTDAVRDRRLKVVWECPRTAFGDPDVQPGVIGFDGGCKACNPVDSGSAVVPVSEIEELVSLDPRPAYADDANRIYGFRYGVWEVKFRVSEEVAYIVSVEESR